MRHTVGIIGSGTIVQNIHLPLLKARKDVEVLWVGDTNSSLGSDVARSFGVRFLPLPDGIQELSEPHIILLATPHFARNEYYDFLAGKQTHLYVEKPFAKTVAEHEAIVSMFPNSKVCCGLQRRSWTAANSLGNFLRERCLGSPKRIRVDHGTLGRFGAASNGSFHTSAVNGLVMESAIHILDLALHLSQAIEIISSTGFQVRYGDHDVHTEAQLHTVTSLFGDIEVDVFISGLVTTSNSISIQFDQCVLEFSERSGALSIKGGSQVFDLQEHGGQTAVSPFHIANSHWSAFLESVAGGADNHASASTSVMTTRAVSLLSELPGPCT
jgi:predicted dehydrogenase